MMLESLFGLSLVLNVSLDIATPPADPAARMQMSMRQKDAAMLPLVRRATACIARQVSVDPRYSVNMMPGPFKDLIIDSISACERPVRVMIDTHDRRYGFGSGAAFLLGPYLDVLPSAVGKQVRVRTPARWVAPAATPA